MLFVFLLDNGEAMNEVKFVPYTSEQVNYNDKFNNHSNLNNKTYSLNSSFFPTSMDASIYFIQQYSKVTSYSYITYVYIILKLLLLLLANL